jgi:hypothetical protein
MQNIATELKNYYKVKYLDSNQIGKEKAIKIIIEEDHDLLLTYNKTGTDLVLKDKLKNESCLLASLKKPHIAWLTEHPVTFFEQYLQSEANRHYILAHESHSEFAKAVGLKGTFSSQMFGSNYQKNIPKTNERIYDICIAAQWRGPAENNVTWDNSSKAAKAFFNTALTLQEEDPNRDSYNAYLNTAKKYNIDGIEVKKHGGIIRSLYWYARKNERINLVKQLATSGLKIIFIGGEEWAQILPNVQNITFAPACSHTILKEWYKKSKIVATVNNYNGANERIFDALSCGAAVFCENSPQLIKNLASAPAIFYRPNNAQDSFHELESMLNIMGKTDISADCAKFSSHHTWRQRIDVIKPVIDQLLVS